MVDYGQDFDCVTDLRPDLGVVTGRLVLAQAIARRLSTPRGALLSDPNYGLDITAWLNDGATPAQIAARVAMIDAEILKDQRVISSSTTFTFSNSVLTITTALRDGDGPFSLVLDVTAGGVTIAALEAA